MVSQIEMVVTCLVVDFLEQRVVELLEREALARMFHELNELRHVVDDA